MECRHGYRIFARGLEMPRQEAQNCLVVITLIADVAEIPLEQLVLTDY
jgi:hypothetical protein